MSTLLTESDLLRCFREIDRPEVELPADLAFPLAVDEVASWAIGPRAFLVFRERPEARPRGIVFHRTSSALPDAAAMCEWCHAVRGNGAIKLMSVCADQRRRIGLYLCSDLDCVSRARAAPTPDDVPDRADGDERSRRALRRIADFASRRLF